MEWKQRKHLICNFIVKNHFHIHFTVFILMLVPYYLKFYSKYWHNGINVLFDGFITVLFTYGLLCITPTQYIMNCIRSDTVVIDYKNEYNLFNKILITTTIPVIILFWVILSVYEQ